MVLSNKFAHGSGTKTFLLKLSFSHDSIFPDIKQKISRRQAGHTTGTPGITMKCHKKDTKICMQNGLLFQVSILLDLAKIYTLCKLRVW